MAQSYHIGASCDYVFAGLRLLSSCFMSSVARVRDTRLLDRGGWGGKPTNARCGSTRVWTIFDADAEVVTDGHAGYNSASLGERSHGAIVQTKADRRESDAQ
jgi:hypothetical protein